MFSYFIYSNFEIKQQQYLLFYGEFRILFRKQATEVF